MDESAVEEAARKVAAKPALKKHPLHMDGGTTPDGDDARRKKGHLKWDEEVIAEHDQLRGTRMKVSCRSSLWQFSIHHTCFFLWAGIVSAPPP